jgi:hypothetical protein
MTEKRRDAFTVAVVLALLVASAPVVTAKTAEGAEIKAYQAESIAPYQAEEIKPYAAKEIKPYKAKEILRSSPSPGIATRAPEVVAPQAAGTPVRKPAEAAAQNGKKDKQQSKETKAVPAKRTSGGGNPYGDPYSIT